MRRPNTVPVRCCAAVSAILGFMSPAASAPAEETITIEDLLKSGWQIAGYTSTFDNRSSLILFRNAEQNYLVRCLSGYDVTRNPRTYSNCYQLK